MAIEIFCRRVNDYLLPASQQDREKLHKLERGQTYRLKFSKVRNYEFHKKYFALLNFAFDHWEPENEVAEKNFDQFREDIIILAGYFHRYVRMDNSTRIKAKSISFASMDEVEFEKLYSASIGVIVKHICQQYTDESLREVLAEVENFE